ncbi:hypothetical protein Tco_1109781 [Tanacetum coccineum]|uniref:Uncharacterized protein n=1 Tax=Tanacetum coccineum TaxID=301880 RepID=A0ABQ5IJD3_9ASTR
MKIKTLSRMIGLDTKTHDQEVKQSQVQVNILSGLNLGNGNRNGLRCSRLSANWAGIIWCAIDWTMSFIGRIKGSILDGPGSNRHSKDNARPIVFIGNMD